MISDPFHWRSWMRGSQKDLKIRGQNAEKRTTVVTSFPRFARFVCATVVLAAGLVYLNALDNPFIYDDHVLIGENPSLLTPLNLRGLVLHDLARPVINVSYAVDRTLWGPRPFGFHLTNVLLHLLNVALLFILTMSALRHGERRSADVEFEPDARLSTMVVATVAALLLAVHPMMTGAVGYISARSEVFCTSWLLLALLSAQRWMRTARPGWLGATAGLWLLALATKETAAMFPLVLLLFDRLVIPTTDRTERRRRVAWLHLPFFGITMLFVVARVVVLSFVEHAEPVIPQWRIVLAEIDVVRRYLLLLLTPGVQSIFHAVTPVSGFFDTRVILSLVTIGVLVGLAWRVRRVAALASFGFAWFLLLLVPSSMLVVLDRGEPMAEHRVYAASVGLFLTIGWVAGWLIPRLSELRPVTMRVVQIAFIVWLAILGGRTVLRNTQWSDPVAVWTQAAARAPDHWVPQLLLGEELQRAGRCEEAVGRFRTAIRLYPDETNSYRKLGGCLIELRRLDEARAAFEQLRARSPASIHATNGLGVLALLGGQSAFARQYFLETLVRDPRNVQAKEALATLEPGLPGPIARSDAPDGSER